MIVKHFILPFSIALALISCDDTPQRVLPKGKKPIIAEKAYPKDREAPIDIPPPPAPYSGPKKFCFEMELGNSTHDITRMQFVLDDNDSIVGQLDYSFADRSPIHGIKQGKFVDLLYTFTDSSKRKQEQINLKWEDNKLFKKNGPMVDEDGILVLENPLRASLELFLIKTNCK